MATTPVRRDTLASSSKSPGTPSRSTNVASLRVQEAVALFVEFHRKWAQAVEKGSQYCNAIKNIKNSVLQAASTECPYPENLLLYCKNLLTLVSIMDDVIANASYVISQIQAVKEYFPDDAIVGNTWTFGQTLSVVEMAITSYKAEIITRKYIAEYIGHALSTDQLSLFVCSWINMTDIEKSREFRIKMMTVEFNLQ